MESQSSSQVRFSDSQPPGSPKSCMKGSRKLTFEEKVEPGGEISFATASTSQSTTSTAVVQPSTSTAPPPRSPRKGVKVCIRSPGDSSSCSSSSTQTSKQPPEVAPFAKPPPDIQLSTHFDQSTPPPNCTSNGAYDFAEAPPSSSSSTTTSGEQQDMSNTDPRNDPYLMDVANKFVNEILETASLEAAKRQKPEEPKANLTSIARDIIATGRRSVWVQRAQGTVSKWFTNLCVKAQNTIRT